MDGMKNSPNVVQLLVSIWIGTKIRDNSVDYGVSKLRKFLIEIKEKVGIDQIISALEVSLCTTPAKWSVIHKITFPSWDQTKLAM